MQTILLIILFAFSMYLPKINKPLCPIANAYDQVYSKESYLSNIIISSFDADTIIDDNFITETYDYLDLKVVIETLRTNDFGASIQLVENSYSSNDMDTTITYTSNSDTLKYYLSNGKSFLEKATITSDKFSIGKIKTGLPSKILSDKLDIKKIPARLIIYTNSYSSELTILTHKNLISTIYIKRLYGG